jgi:hypothetical protein
MTPWRHLRWLVPLLAALGIYSVAYDKMHLPPTGDQPHYELEAWSLVYDGDRDLRNDYTDPDRTRPAFGGPAPDFHAHPYGSSPRWVSHHHVGLPILLTPAAALSHDVKWMEREMILISAIAAVLLLSVLRRLHGRDSILLYVVWAAIAFSLPVVAFAPLVYPEIPGVLLGLLAVLALLQRPFRRRDAALGALAAALMPWLHIRYLYAALGLMVLLAARSAGAAGLRVPRSLRDVATLARVSAPALVPMALSLAAMSVAFHFWHDSFALNAQFRGLNWSLSSGYPGIAGAMFAADGGWVTLAPVMLLGLSGLIYVCWRHPAWGLAGAAVGLGYLTVGGFSGLNPGYSFPWRFDELAIPFIALPLLIAAADVRLIRLAAIPLVVLTFAFTVNGANHVRDLYPQPGRAVPALPLAKKLQSAWPNFATLPGSGDRYPDAAHVVAIVLSLALIGGLLVPARDWRYRRRAV